jgi:CRISPR-associated protein Cas2
VRNTFLVTYDICNDRRLAQVHKTMRGFGDHLQYSVFECQLSRADLASCRSRLSAIIDRKKGQVLFVDLGPVEGRGDRVSVRSFPRLRSRGLIEATTEDPKSAA